MGPFRTEVAERHGTAHLSKVGSSEVAAALRPLCAAGGVAVAVLIEIVFGWCTFLASRIVEC
jgi:hypothetical protein